MRKKPAYSIGVTTQRLINNLIVKVEDDDRAQQIADNLFQHETADRHVTEAEKENTRIIRATLRSKAYVNKTLSMLYIPKSFLWLMLICGLVTLVSLGLAGSEYAIFTALFDELEHKVSVMYSQAIEYVHLAKAGAYILQAVAINEYGLMSTG